MVPSEPQPGSSGNLNVTDILSLPQSQAMHIGPTTLNVTEQNSELQQGHQRKSKNEQEGRRHSADPYTNESTKRRKKKVKLAVGRH